MKKLVLTEEQFNRMFKHTISEQEDVWSQMDDQEKREYLQGFTSDSEKIEQMLRSPEDPTKEFEGMNDEGDSGDMTVERSTEEILNDMEGDVNELKRSIDLIKSRM
jgi:chaperonin cofactor prefoldin